MTGKREGGRGGGPDQSKSKRVQRLPVCKVQ